MEAYWGFLGRFCFPVIGKVLSSLYSFPISYFLELGWDGWSSNSCFVRMRISHTLKIAEQQVRKSVSHRQLCGATIPAPDYLLLDFWLPFSYLSHYYLGFLPPVTTFDSNDTDTHCLTKLLPSIYIKPTGSEPDAVNDWPQRRATAPSRQQHKVKSLPPIHCSCLNTQWKGKEYEFRFPGPTTRWLSLAKPLGTQIWSVCHELFNYS